MVGIKDSFLKQIWDLPFVDGYLYGRFFYSKYPEGDTVRYGSFFIEDGNIKFLILIEIPKKLPDLGKLKSVNIEGEKVYIGYSPDFSLLKNWPNAKKLSWLKGNRIFTIVSINNHEKIKKYVKKVLISESSVPKSQLLSLFEKSKYLPSSIEDWELVTMFFWFNSVLDGDNSKHFIKHIQGNYKKGKNFLNTEIRFGCSHPISLFGLRSGNTENGKNIKLNGFEIKKARLNQENFISYLNSEERYSVICHDNKQNKEKGEEILRLLMKNTIDKLGESVQEKYL